MPVSVETLKGLERKVTVSVPTEEVEEEVGLRLRDLARKVKMDGFRPGKVPLHVVKNRFSDSVREEVAKEMVQATLYEALKEKDLHPAGLPTIEPQQIELGKDFIYTATFEVFPSFDIVELDNAEIELVRAEVKNSDVAVMLEKLREQNKEWQEVSRPAAKNDKVFIDFEGFIDNKPFAGGDAKNFDLVIGSGAMIPGFEENLIGAEKDKSFEMKVTFPNDYGAKDLAGKEATFKITAHKVLEGKLPALDNDFAKKFNLEEGGIEALTRDIKANMIRELERQVSAVNRENVFDKLMAINPFDLPKTLIDKEIEHLRHEMYHRLFGHEHADNEKIPDFPRSLFEEKAKRRVHLGLLVSEYVKKHEIVADKERVSAMIDKFAAAYEDPDELRAWYFGNKERLAEVEAMVTEEMIAEKISEKAKVVEKTKDYEEIMNPKKDSTAEGGKQ